MPVVGSPSSDDRSPLTRRNSKWRYKETGSPRRDSRCKLNIDAGEGRLVLKAKKKVVGIFLGYRPVTRVAIVGVTSESGGVRVSFRVVPDTNVYFVAPPPHSHYLLEMTRTNERILCRDVSGK